MPGTFGYRAGISLQCFLVLEGRDTVQNALTVSWPLNRGKVATSTIRDTGFGHLCMLNCIAGRDILRTNNPGNQKLAHLGVHFHFLAAGDDEIAIRQNVRNDGRNRQLNIFRPVD